MCGRYHPYAQELYDPRVYHSDESWPTSTLRDRVSDAQWHHVGFQVQQRVGLQEILCVRQVVCVVRSTPDLLYVHLRAQ